MIILADYGMLFGHITFSFEIAQTAQIRRHEYQAMSMDELVSAMWCVVEIAERKTFLRRAEPPSIRSLTVALNR
jgi:hypothetical protein